MILIWTILSIVYVKLLLHDFNIAFSSINLVFLENSNGTYCSSLISAAGKCDNSKFRQINLLSIGNCWKLTLTTMEIKLFRLGKRCDIMQSISNRSISLKVCEIFYEISYGLSILFLMRNKGSFQEWIDMKICFIYASEKIALNLAKKLCICLIKLSSLKLTIIKNVLIWDLITNYKIIICYLLIYFFYLIVFMFFSRFH